MANKSDTLLVKLKNLGKVGGAAGSTNQIGDALRTANTNSANALNRYSAAKAENQSLMKDIYDPSMNGNVPIKPPEMVPQSQYSNLSPGTVPMSQHPEGLSQLQQISPSAAAQQREINAIRDRIMQAKQTDTPNTGAAQAGSGLSSFLGTALSPAVSILAPIAAGAMGAGAIWLKNRQLNKERDAYTKDTLDRYDYMINALKRERGRRANEKANAG